MPLDEETKALIDAHLAQRAAAAPAAPAAPATPAPSAAPAIDYQHLAAEVAKHLQPAAAAQPQTAPAPSGGGDDDKYAEALRALAPPAAARTLFSGPGAPAGPPSGVIENDPTKWSRDYINRLRSEGRFLEELEKFRDSLPGAGNAVFKKRIPRG